MHDFGGVLGQPLDTFFWALTIHGHDTWLLCGVALRAALHLEAGPIWWYDLFNLKMYVMTRPEPVELGAPKMEGQLLA